MGWLQGEGLNGNGKNTVNFVLKFKKTEILLSIFSDDNSMKLEMNHMKKTLKTDKDKEAK